MDVESGNASVVVSVFVNSSRSILYAHDGDDFADAAAEAAAELQGALG